MKKFLLLMAIITIGVLAEPFDKYMSQNISVNGYHSVIEFLTAFEFMNSKSSDMKEMGRILHKYGDTYAHSKLDSFDEMGNAIISIDSIKTYGKPIEEESFITQMISKAFSLYVGGGNLATADHYHSDKTKPDKISERPNWYIQYVENLAMLVSLKFNLNNSLHNEFQKKGIKLFEELAIYAKKENVSLIGIINYKIAEFKNKNKKTFIFYVPFGLGKPILQDSRSHNEHIANTEKYLKSKFITYKKKRNSKQISNQSTGGHPVEIEYKGTWFEIFNK